MPRNLTLERAMFIPSGAVMVRDKLSDAVAYVFNDARGRPCARLFYGAQAKPVWSFYFRNEADRETRVRRGFESRRAWAAMQAEHQAQRRKPSKLQLGHILVASWGYEQTNVDFYQVTKIVSPTMVEIRKISACNEDTLFMQGRCTPRADDFIGEAKRRRVKYGDTIKVDDVRTAHLWDGRPMSWSSYH